MITITTRLILMALLSWWLVKEHEFKQNRQALDKGGADLMHSVEVDAKYSYVLEDKFPNA